jgi:hypothetical protein
MELELYKFRGQDKSMLTEYKHRISNTLSVCISVDESNTDIIIYKRTLYNIRKLLKNPKSNFRAKQYDEEHYCYNDMKTNKLSKKIIKICDSKLTHLELGQILVDTELSCIFRIYKNFIFVAVTHVFFDGISIAKLFKIVFDKDPTDLSVVPVLKYYPIITELPIIPKTFQLLTHLPKRNLSYDACWKEERIPLFTKHYSIEKSKLFQIKRYLEKKHDGKYGFSASLAVISVLFVFKYTNKNKISIGLTSAFNNTEHFNNFSACILIIERPYDWQNMNTKEQLINIGQQVNNALFSYGKEQSLLFYLISNIYEFNFYANHYIDCIVSCAPIRFPVIFNDKPAKIENMEIYGTSMPLYMGYWTNNDYLNVDIFSRSYDLKLKETTPFIIDKLVKNIHG